MSSLSSNYTARKSFASRQFTAKEFEDWHDAIIRIYNRMRAAAKRPYEVQHDGICLIVHPNVYAPGFFTDSMWFARELPVIVGQGSVLEVGTGTGIISIACARAGARVTATDINPDAIKNARQNALRNNVDIQLIDSDLFSAIGAAEKFDYIFWAHPFNNWREEVSDMLLRSGMDHQYKSLRGYIAGAKFHLAPHGRLLLGTGDSADLDTIFMTAAEHEYRPKLLKETEMPLEVGGDLPIKYFIYEFVPF